ncbi:type I DNA topoisomerase [Candidatus Gracilibacteria bacterium]|nr:type I DNA topoisomerase [Candidatus Gracilibacteria bacterium]
MSKNLVIVESPAKAKTIEKFLGKDFIVKSSYGHIRDLPKKKMGVDIENNFEPTYEISPDKKKTVAELKKVAKGKEVWLAADEDREGEAIAWHVCEALKLDPRKTKRIVFHEITKPAIVKSIEMPRTVNMDLVDAQQARRILDRLVGYELSPVLWKKIQAGLSAGRVQSVAVRLIVEREREIEAFNAHSVFKVTAEFDLGNGKVLKAELSQTFKTQEEAKGFLEKCKEADFTVESLEIKPGKKSPAAPFTTSTLQQEASRKLGFSVKQTMMVAQRLYEAGKITYMRTDSLNLSDQAIAQAAVEIEKNYGKQYLEVRKYKTKSANAQEAHEAIRPTDFACSEVVKGERNEIRLYDLIWKRTIASQMAQAKIEKTVATISVSTTEEKLVALGEVLKFDGFLKVYLEGTDDEENAEEKNMLPPLKEGQDLVLAYMMAKQNFSRPKARYTEASLVKKMEEMGIGRPSTYAPTISTIQDRKYIEKKGLDSQQRAVQILTLRKGDISEEEKQENFGAEKNKLFPTEIGKIVTDFLVKHFTSVLDYGFTAKAEEEFDKIAEGKTKWNKMIQGFYGGFHQLIEDSGGISKEEASSVRELGVDPKSKKPVFARIGRFGPMIQIGTKDDEEKPKFASIPEDKTIEKITLEEALAQFEFPKLIGKTPEGDEIMLNLGRFGPYLKIGKLNVGLKKEVKGNEGEVIPGDNPNNLSLTRALELYEEKKEQEKNRYIAEWPDEKIWVLRGPFGIYIKADKKNVRIPKSIEDPEKLTLEACKEIIAAAPASKGRRRK